MNSRVLAVLMLGAAWPLPNAGAARARRMTFHESKQTCLQEDPQLKGKALRMCIKAKRAK